MFLTKINYFYDNHQMILTQSSYLYLLYYNEVFLFLFIILINIYIICYIYITEDTWIPILLNEL